MKNLNRIKAELTGTWLNQKRIVNTLADSGEASWVPYVGMWTVEQLLGETYHEISQLSERPNPVT